MVCDTQTWHRIVAESCLGDATAMSVSMQTWVNYSLQALLNVCTTSLSTHQCEQCSGETQGHVFMLDPLPLLVFDTG